MFILKLYTRVLLICIIGIACISHEMNAQTEEDIPEAIISDPELEAAILKSINQYAKEKHWEEVFTKAIITSGDWSVLRDFTTGTLSGRIIDTAVLAKWPDGHCTYREIKVLQEFNGLSFSKGVSRYSSTYPTKCPCDSF